jgi:hypothetical protein
MTVADGQAPYWFGYGKDKQTIKEGHLTLTDRHYSVPNPNAPSEPGTGSEWAGAEARLFGSASLQTLSASIGAEGQVGDEAHSKTHSPAEQADYLSDGFIGIQGRAYGEAGVLGAGVGAELFAGVTVRDTRNEGDVGSGNSDWNSEVDQVDLGIRTAAKAHVGPLGASASVWAEAGLHAYVQTKNHGALGHGLGGIWTNTCYGFVGVATKAEASVGPTGASAGVDAFAGARAGWRPEVGLAYNGEEVLGAFLNLEGRIGFGASADVSFGIDWEKRRIGLSGDAGLAVGIGASVGGGISIGGNDVGKSVDTK